MINEPGPQSSLRPGATDHIEILLFQMKKTMVESSQPSATKYMKRFLSPTSTERQPLHPGKEVSSRYILCCVH